MVGANGSIGSALIAQIHQEQPNAEIHTISRSAAKNINSNIKNHTVDYLDENNIHSVCANIYSGQPLDLVIIATGILHDSGVYPEKSISQLSPKNLQHLFNTNTVIPTLFIKYLMPCMNKTNLSKFAILSARIGSITDNKLGGWYAYRASKAALNMIIKTASIELQRNNKKSIIIGLHPGTVDSPLSQPFQHNIPQQKLFTPKYSACKLLEVVNNLCITDNGKIIAWDGTEIPP